MYCSKCGKQVADDANFCKYCGYDFSNDESALPSENSTTELSCDAKDDTEKVESDITPSNEQLARERVDSIIEDGMTKGEVKRVKARKEREIQDAISLDKYTIKDETVKEATYISKDRIELRDRGSLAKLKTKEIVYIVLSAIVMILSAVLIAVFKKQGEVDDDTMNAFVIMGYMMFFVIFLGLAFGIDRVYNLLTLIELSTRKITLKKYGFRLSPLALVGGKVKEISIKGECDMCNGENKGTYIIEWQNDELIAVCNYNRQHVHRIDIYDILCEDEDAVHTEEN